MFESKLEANDGNIDGRGSHPHNWRPPAIQYGLRFLTVVSHPFMLIENLRIFISYPRGGAAHTWAEDVHTHLDSQGARVFRDEDSIKEGEQDWYRRIEQGLLNADLVVAIVGDDSAICRWQERELLYADRLGLSLVPLRIAPVSLPFVITEKQPVEARRDRAATWEALFDAIERLEIPGRSAPLDGVAGGIPVGQRRAELEWLDSLVFRVYSDREARYVPVAGRERESLSSGRAMKGLRMDTHVLLKAFRVERDAETVNERTYSDVLDAYRALPSRKVRRLAVLGEPGAGKSFSLERIAVDYARLAQRDEAAPIPLLVPLGLWTRDGENLEAFIARNLGELGRHLPELIRQGRAVLLLDAINEIPPGQRRHKAAQIMSLAADERLASVIVSCREKDFTEFDLPFDTLTLQLLSPLQVREFLQRFFALKCETGGDEVADALFWRMAGGEEIRAAWEAWCKEAQESSFWTDTTFPSGLNPYLWIFGQHKAARYAYIGNPRNLLRLAANPYLLHIMAELGADLPANRARLFEGFLRVLYDRETKARETRHDRLRPVFDPWLRALSLVAEKLQRMGTSENDDGARTALSRIEWPPELTAELLDFSQDANVLELHGEDVRFSHQLLQEYLASRVLLEESRGGRLALAFWPPASWWKRTGWEVVAEIAAESCAEDEKAFHGLLDWLGRSNPEVAADAWRYVGSPSLPPKLLQRFRKRWLEPMTDPKLEPSPAARAAIGRALGRLGLDDRPGVGLRPDGLPDIAWVEIAGPEPFIYQGKSHPGLPTFWLAKYPVTYAQFRAFIDDGGYREDRWWHGLARREDAPIQPAWDELNSPRETVNWFEAIAFCRWLSARTGQPISLPTEEQWERAAAGRDGRYYPWGNSYEDGLTNRYYEDGDGLGRTSAVGVFPLGTLDQSLLDLAGNVSEFCLNEFAEPGKLGTKGDATRAVRGGAWTDDSFQCRTYARDDTHPGYRHNFVGFRVCRNSPIDPPDAATPITGS